MSTIVEEAKALPVSERIRIVEAIWNTIADEPESLEITPEQAAELDRRIAYYDQHADESVPWEVVKAKYLARR